MKLKSKLSYYFLLLIEFTTQEALSCLFPVLIFATLVLVHGRTQINMHIGKSFMSEKLVRS